MNRFKWWTMLVFTSGLVWFSLAYKFYEDKCFGEQDKIVLVLYSSTIILSISGLLTSMCYEGKKKKWSETILILTNLILWIVLAIATLVGESPYLKQIDELVIDSAEDNYNISSPNIYFFSFGSFFNAVYLTSSWFKQYVIRDENALTTTQWMFLATSGFLVMMTGISLFDEQLCEENDDYSCARSIFGVVVGLLSGVISCVLLPWRSAPLKCQAEMALILLVTWAAAIGLLTFNTGPAVKINTMYFGIYLSFFLSMNILITANYADSVLEASPYSQVEFGRADSDLVEDARGATGFLDFAYANMTQPQAPDPADDPRHADMSTAMLFESVGGSLSSVVPPDNVRSSSEVERESIFNKKVHLGKRDLSRIEIWFILLIESVVSLTVFYQQMDKSKAVTQQWVILAPTLSIGICFVGWLTSSIQKKCAYIVEGILILASIAIWIRGLIAVTYYFKDDTTNQGGMASMTANQLFMSYGSFFTSLFLFTTWSNASVTTTDWIFLSAASATIFGVLLITADDSAFGQCDLRTDFDTCGQLQLIILFSLGSACTAVVMVLLSLLPCERIMPFVHITVGTTLLALWGVGSYFIVFQKGGYGTEIGPTFFACWGSLFFCVDITTTNLVLLCSHRLVEDEDESASSRDGDENFEDDDENERLSIHSDDDDDQDLEQTSHARSELGAVDSVSYAAND